MKKRLPALLLIAALLISVTACGLPERLEIPEKKVVILAPSRERYPEEYAAAVSIAEKYSEAVSVREYNDRTFLSTEDPEIITVSKELAADSDVGALIYLRGTQYSDYAQKLAKEANDKLRIITVEPEVSVENIVKTTDLMLCADWKKCCADMLDIAQKRNAKYFVFWSFDRHMENPLYISLRGYLEAGCKEKGIAFVGETGLDSAYYDGNREPCEKISESLDALYKDGKVRGNNVALFSTDDAVQSALVKECTERNLIYICPSFPTVYSGIGGVLGVSSKATGTDSGSYVSDIKKALKGSSGRFSVYTYPLASVMVKSAVKIAFDMLAGKTYYANFEERVPLRVAECAKGGKFTVERFDFIDNMYICYSPSFENI
ncbi:MAG: DUF3798 domain-containing protein [Clostridia bacterium]|nr:DUF3798 domain-containing protein [Clostridia bacterium]